MKTISKTETVKHAPQNFVELKDKIVTSDGEGLFEKWHGSGIPSDIECAHCQNTLANKQIYGNWGHSYPNGNSWDDLEIICGICQKFTQSYGFKEG